jgi:hypothetical protein
MSLMEEISCIKKMRPIEAVLVYPDSKGCI